MSCDVSMAKKAAFLGLVASAGMVVEGVALLVLGREDSPSTLAFLLSFPSLSTRPAEAGRTGERDRFRTGDRDLVLRLVCGLPLDLERDRDLR